MAVQSQLYNLGVGGVPQSRVKNLGDDLMGLFGAVGKGVQTYDTIGSEAAKLEFLSQQNAANEEIIKQRALLDKASAINDTSTILAVKSNIDNITASVVAKSDDFKNHKAAFEEYNTRALGFSISTRSEMYHNIDLQYMRASRENRYAEIEKLEEQKSKTGMLFNSQDYDDSKSQNKYSFFNEEDSQKVFASFFKHNISSLNNTLTKIPSEVVKTYNLFTQDKEGNISYSLDAERKMILEKFGDTYTTDSIGAIIAGSGNNQPDEQEKNLLAQALINFRSKVIDSNGNAWSAEFDEYMTRAEQNLTSYKNGDMTDEVLSKDKFEGLALNIPISHLSNEQVKKRQKYIIDKKLAQDRNTLIYETFKSFMHKSVGEISSELKVMENEGISLSGGVSVDGTRISKEASKWAKNGDAYTRRLFNEGNTQELITVLPSWMKMHQAITGQSLPIMDDIREIVNGSVTKAYSGEERLRANTVLASLSKSGEVSLPVLSQYAIEQKAIDIETIKQQSLDENGQFSKQIFDKKVKEHSASGATSFIENTKRNASQLKNADVADIMSSFNFPDPKFLTEEERAYFGRVASFQGILFNSKDDFEEFMSNNYEMKTKGTFSGKATFVPKPINDDAHNEIEKYMYEKAGISKTAKDYSISYIMKDPTNKSVRVNLTKKDGGVVYRQDFDVNKLSALTKKESHKEPSNTTKPIPNSSKFITVNNSKTIPKKGNMSKSPPHPVFQNKKE